MGVKMKPNKRYYRKGRLAFKKFRMKIENFKIKFKKKTINIISKAAEFQ